MADGSSSGEAVANAQIVIADRVETAKSLIRSIPEPKGKLAYA
jgi:predicted RNase H-like HicB family nuclease